MQNYWLETVNAGGHSSFLIRDNAIDSSVMPFCKCVIISFQ